MFSFQQNLNRAKRTQVYLKACEMEMNLLLTIEVEYTNGDFILTIVRLVGENRVSVGLIGLLSQSFC